MPDYPSDYYIPNDHPTPPPTDPCPDGECCPPSLGPGGAGGPGGGPGGSPGGFGGGCGARGCLAASSSHPIRYATGALELVANDLYASGFGDPWGHTRTYGHRLFQNGTLDSHDGVNGRNWFIATAPYLVETAEGSDGGSIAVMGNINATLWFDFVGSAPSAYVNRFGGLELLEHDAIARVFRLRSPDGSITEFHDFDQTTYSQGLFKRRVSAGGQVTEVASYTGGEIGEIQRTATIDGAAVTESLQYIHGWYGRLTHVTSRRRVGTGAWTNAQQVRFTYWSTEGGSYWNEPVRGSSGDLRSAETYEWNGSSWNRTGVTYYAYYSGSEANGFVFGLKYVLGPDAVARMVADGKASWSGFTGSIQIPSSTNLANYADHYFEYDSQRRVTKEMVQAGTLGYQYAYATSSHPEDKAHWKTKTTETLPDGTQRRIYSNANGQTLLTVHQTASGDWLEFAEYDGNGHRTLRAHSSAVVSYDDTQADLGVVLKANDGLIELSEYYGVTDPAPHKLKSEWVRQGSTGTPIKIREYEYTSHTANGSTVHRLSKETVYKNEDGSGAIETSHAYTWHAGTNQIEQQTTTLPAVPTSQNGSGIAATRVQRFDLHGNPTWSQDERGVISQQRFDIATGALVQTIADVDTSLTIDAPAGWATIGGFGSHLITDYEHDDQGRVTRVLGPEHTADVAGVPTPVRRAQWTAYLANAQGRETRSGQGFLKVSDSSETLINPVSIRKQTHQGRTLEEIQAVQGLPGGSSGGSSGPGGSLEDAQVSVAGPLSSDEFAFPQESYVRWSTHQYANCCQLVSSRAYHKIPEFGVGAEGVNYGQTSFDHDTMSRRNRVQSPGGTIRFTVFDARGQQIENWIGTNDTGATEADPSGGGLDPDNDMVLVTENEYDDGFAGGDGNLTKQTQHVDDTTTRVTSFLYDWRNRLTETDGEEDYFEKRYFDNLGRVVKTERYDTNASGNLVARSEALFDDRGRVYRNFQHGVDPVTGSLTSEILERDSFHDASGNLIRREPDGTAEYVAFEFDSLDRLISRTDPLGHATTYSYDDAGNQISVTDPTNHTTTTGFDAIGRIVVSTDPLGHDTMFDYDPAGRQNVVTDANGQATTTAYDAARRPVSVTDPLSHATTFTYTPEGQRASITDANNLTTTWTYDGLGRMISVTDPLNHATAYGYNRLGERITMTDPKGNSSTIDYDGLGRVVTETDRLGHATQHAYNTLGNLASLTDAEGQVTQYEYDGLGRQTRIIWPDHVAGTVPGDLGYGITETAYDSIGRLLRRTDQQGDTVTFVYDAAGRLVQRDYRTRANSPTGSIADSDTFTHDDAGRLLSAVSGRYSNTVTLTYDATGRKITESLTISGQTYASQTQYDAASRVSKLIYPDGSEVMRTYTARGQLATLAVDSTTIDTRLYDAGGRLTSSSYHNGVGETRSYNDDNTLASINYSGAPIGNLSYTWDANKNKTSESIGGVMSGYGFTASYDDEDRLIGWDRSDASLDQSWDLSPVDDWYSITENASVQNRTHGPVHEILTAASQAVQHDPKGNMTLIPPVLRSGSDPLKLKWDFDNKLRAADTDNDGVDDVFYRWDALGRRVGRDDGTNHTIYFQDGWQTLADYVAGTAASSPTYTYVYGSYIDEVVLRSGGSGVRYYHRNQQYSITALTDPSGVVIERYAYTAYGQVTFADASGTVQADSASNNRYTYTGREWDARLSLHHFRARMYDPVSGRFLSRDPVGYVSGFNLFASYFGLSNTDPAGLHPAVLVVGGVVITYEAAAAIAAAYGLTVAACLAHNECRESLRSGARAAAEGIDDALAAARTWVTSVIRWIRDCRLHCNMKVDKPDHPFYYPTTTYPFIKRCFQNHVQVNCYLRGVPGSRFNFRAPFGPCCKNANCEGGIVH